MCTALAVALTILMQAQQPASSAPDPRAKPTAQALLKEGAKLYRKGQFHGALERFTEAYRLYPSPKLQFNIGQANRELGRSVQALQAFESFLSHPENAPASARREARASVKALHAQLGRLKIEVQRPEVEVLVDGERVGRTPLPLPLWVTAGEHEVALRGQGLYPVGTKVTVPAGGLRTVQLTVRPLLAPARTVAMAGGPGWPAPPASDQQLAGGQWYRRWWVWALAGTAVVVGGGALMAGRSGGPPMPATTLGTQEAFR